MTRQYEPIFPRNSRAPVTDECYKLEQKGALFVIAIAAQSKASRFYWADLARRDNLR